MPLFGKKNAGPEIPPVESMRNDLLGGARQPSNPNLNSIGRQQGSGSIDRAPSYRTVDSQQQASQPQRPNPYSGSSYGSGSYGNNNYNQYGQQPQQQRGGAGYGQQQYESSRAELFRNAPAPRATFGSQNLDQPYDQYGANNDQQDGQVRDEEEEVEAIKQQMRMTKQESLASTRNALRAAREAEETARNTLTKLGDQSERLGNTDRALDMTNAYNERSKDEAKEIAALNRSIFRPNFGFNKQAKRDAEERRILERHQNEREEREENRRQLYESRARVEGAFKAADRSVLQDQRDAKYKQAAAAYGGKGGAGSKLSGRAKYQFEADQEDDELEQELDENLNEIGDLSKRLNLLAGAMGDEVRSQNKKLDSMNTKTDILDSRIYSNTQKLSRLK